MPSQPYTDAELIELQRQRDERKNVEHAYSTGYKEGKQKGELVASIVVLLSLVNSIVWSYLISLIFN